VETMQRAYGGDMPQIVQQIWEGIRSWDDLDVWSKEAAPAMNELSPRSRFGIQTLAEQAGISVEEQLAKTWRELRFWLREGRI